MKPIHKLSSQSKVKILHQLFPGEIPQFIEYTRTLTVETIDDKEELARVWSNQVLALSFWLTLAQTLIKRIKYFDVAIYHCKGLFAKQLFKGNISIFTIHALWQYSNTDNCSPRFAQAVALLFQ